MKFDFSEIVNVIVELIQYFEKANPVKSADRFPHTVTTPFIYGSDQGCSTKV